MNKAQPLSGKNREQRHSRREQHYIPEREYIPLDKSEFYAFVESASVHAVKYAVRDYVDSKDFVTNKQLDERLAASERYIVAELRNEISDLGTALRQEMGQQSTALRQEMGQHRQEMTTTMRWGFSLLVSLMMLGFSVLGFLITR